MSGQKQKIDFSAHEQELASALEKIAKIDAYQDELYPFMEAVKSHFSLGSQRIASTLVVLGSSIPEELVYAGGQTPYWVLGGSRASSLWADSDLPRDADPVSRSALGYFKAGFGDDSLILVPLVSDSSRKLAYLLKTDGFKVHTFHFPSVKDQASFAEWER